MRPRESSTVHSGAGGHGSVPGSPSPLISRVIFARMKIKKMRKGEGEPRNEAKIYHLQSFHLTLYMNIINLFQNQSTVTSWNHSCHYSWIFRYVYKVATIFSNRSWGSWAGNIMAIIHVGLVTIILMKEICWKGENVFVPWYVLIANILQVQFIAKMLMIMEYHKAYVVWVIVVLK